MHRNPISALKAFASKHTLRFETVLALDGIGEASVYSWDMKKRYAYLQIWEPAKPIVLWVMLNPGTGDTEQRRRNTLERCKGWSKDWKYGGLLIGNVFATRAKSSKLLFKTAQPIDDLNDEALRLLSAEAKETIVAWVGKRRAHPSIQRLLTTLRGARCLGVTKKGEPFHPLYVKRAVTPIAWVDPVLANGDAQPLAQAGRLVGGAARRSLAQTQTGVKR